MKQILAIVSSLFIFIQTQAAEVGGSNGQAAPKKSGASLPHCINEASEIDTIKATIKANSKTANKYDGYKKALASDDDVQLAARLAYAETKSTNCEKQNNEILPVITQVIANRVKIRKGDVKSVIFQRDQFASSLNIYDESSFKEFLCPSDEALWKKAYSESFSALSDKTKGSNTVNYFLYKHSPRWTKEPWKLEEDQSLAKGSLRECIRAFRNPAFK
ncbi:hypothetical protein CIK05_14625 [Bdellovibrio sp. qaytius]|nr:hypothetical protein CIK05_14625 [Bdellovibrio sp. qaytius]